jgi:general L-amino acid transport system ATP-binding protein
MSSSTSSTLAGDAFDVAVQIIGLNKWYGEFHVLKDIDLTVKRGERIVICGPSGSGKSTVIRCINGLEEHQKGSIVVDGIELTGDRRRIHEVRREVGMVFQSFNLFPHLTVLENCTLALRWARKMAKSESIERAMHFLSRVRIPEQALPRPIVRRSAAARGNCASAVHEPEDHAVR